MASQYVSVQDLHCITESHSEIFPKPHRSKEHVEEAALKRESSAEGQLKGWWNGKGRGGWGERMTRAAFSGRPSRKGALANYDDGSHTHRR